MIYKYFPENIRQPVKHAMNKIDGLEEIRVRCEKRIILCTAAERYYISQSGNLTKSKNEGIVVNKNQLSEMMRLITKNSVYAVQEEIRNGFITLEDGSRVGICGKCVIADGEIKNIKEVSSLNIRIAGEFKDCALDIYRKLGCSNILIISPPGHGKTTFLRDLIRITSEDGNNITVVDTRGEIAPIVDGRGVFDVGENTDVISGVSKKTGVDMVLRTMNPQVIALDEVSTCEEFTTIVKAINSGVRVFATFHGISKEDFLKSFTDLFENYVYIKKSKTSSRLITYE